MCNLQVPTGGLETFTRLAWVSAVLSLVIIKSIWLVPVFLFGAWLNWVGCGGPATPRVERGEPVAFEKCIQSVRIEGVRSSVKGGVACGPAHVRRGRLDLSLEISRNYQCGTKWDTGNSTTQFAEKGLALITQAVLMWLRCLAVIHLPLYHESGVAYLDVVSVCFPA
ncbi:hypothetical protein AK812_SmicGene12106 [Symbiodinium microadriaticum]|uniref:Uncharacterized protein n=1 Tax=Symbiodinium microadriaticum TaxID=2951 RepID=A0A1Q9EBR8_SYMMI|nr:hypothetical protein AK812_SmicGene12106 [Symbiodinium microadriaticum]